MAVDHGKGLAADAFAVDGGVVSGKWIESISFAGVSNAGGSVNEGDTGTKGGQNEVANTNTISCGTVTIRRLVVPDATLKNYLKSWLNNPTGDEGKKEAFSMTIKPAKRGAKGTTFNFDQCKLQSATFPEVDCDSNGQVAVEITVQPFKFEWK